MQSVLLVDVEFVALNRWHIICWHLESSAAGQLSQASAFPCSGRSFLGWCWAFPGSFSCFCGSPLLYSGLFCCREKVNLLLSWFLASEIIAPSREQELKWAFFSSVIVTVLLFQTASSLQMRGFVGLFALMCFSRPLCPLYHSLSTMCHLDPRVRCFSSQAITAAADFSD